MVEKKQNIGGKINSKSGYDEVVVSTDERGVVGVQVIHIKRYCRVRLLMMMYRVKGLAVKITCVARLMNAQSSYSPSSFFISVFSLLYRQCTYASEANYRRTQYMGFGYNKSINEKKEKKQTSTSKRR